LLIETTAPRPRDDDWVEEAMTHLSLALSRASTSIRV
jgi:hypothetical protein